MFGPQGCGKGTQAKTLSDHLNIPHISTGDIFRSLTGEMKDKVSEIINRGELVPDELTIQILKDRIYNKDCSNGFILDGFPRTIPQATFLDELLKELAGVKRGLRVVNLDVPDEILVVRLLARGRQDDSEATIRRRLEVYREQTSPLIGFYGDREQLITIDGDRSLETVTAELKQLLENRN